MLTVRLFHPFPSAELIAALPKTVTLDRGPRPDQGAGRRRRAALPRGRVGAGRGDGQRRCPVRGHAAGHRRPLWPGLQGDDPLDGQARLRRAGQRQAEAPLHARHLRRRHPPLAADRPRVPPPAPGGRGPGPVLRPRLGRHRGRQQELRQDHRRGHRPLRAGLLRLRLQEVGLDHRLAPALRPQADQEHLPGRGAPTSSPATSSTCISNKHVLDLAKPGATLLLNAPYGPDEVWDQLPARVQQPDRGQAASTSGSSTRSPSRPRSAWATASTR